MNREFVEWLQARGYTGAALQQVLRSPRRVKDLQETYEREAENCPLSLGDTPRPGGPMDDRKKLVHILQTKLL